MTHTIALRGLRFVCLVAALLASLVGTPHAEAAADAIAVPASAVPPAPKPADVAVLMYANRPVLSLAAPYLGMPADERIRRSHDAIEAALARGGPGEVTTRATPQGQLIFIDGVMTIILHAGDVDVLAGDTLEALTERTMVALKRAVRETQEGRNAHELMLSAVWVLVATLVVVLLVYLLRWLRERSLALMAAYGERYLQRLGEGAVEVLRRDRLRRAVAVLDGVVSWSVAALMFYAWLSFCLQRFPYTRPWGEGLNAYLIDGTFHLLKTVVKAVPGLLVALIILLLARAVVSVVGSLFARVESGQIGFKWIGRDAAGPTRRVATWLIWLFALAMAYPYLPGAETEAFKGISVLVGVMLSLGASSFVGQVAGGLILTYSHTLRRGDYVRIGEHEGTVLAVGAFNTRLRTGMGEEIILPNAMIVGNTTTNFSRAVQGHGHVIEITVTVGYDTPWRDVEEALLEAAHRTSGVLDDPAPQMFHTGLKDFYPEYRLVCQSVAEGTQLRAEVMSALRANIQDVCRERGIQLLSPHHVIDPRVLPRRDIQV